MKARSYVVLISLVAVGFPLWAVSITADFNSEAQAPGFVYDGNYAANRYLGTVNARVIPALYCEGFIDYIYMGEQTAGVYATDFAAADTTLAGDTRYGSAGDTNFCNAGSRIDAEITWLGLQMQNLSAEAPTPAAAANVSAIQEAIRTLAGGGMSDRMNSSPASQQNANAPTWGDTTTTAAVPSYTQWITDAENYYSQATAPGEQNPFGSWWSAAAAVGKDGCADPNIEAVCNSTSIGAATSGNIGQDFPGYFSNGLPASTATDLATSEPASLVLSLSGLLAAGFLGRHLAGRGRAQSFSSTMVAPEPPSCCEAG